MKSIHRSVVYVRLCQAFLAGHGSVAATGAPRSSSTSALAPLDAVIAVTTTQSDHNNLLAEMLGSRGKRSE